MSNTVKLAPFLKVVKDITATFSKVKKLDYLNSGEFPIIDQSKNYIAGYTNNNSLINNWNNEEVVIFGDHTRVVKYVDFPIAIGADGVKVLKINSAISNSKYLYYFLKTTKIHDAGYSRHYKFLKALKIPILPLAEQQKTASFLTRIEALIQKRKESIQLLDELIKSTFLDMFGDPYNNKYKFPISTIGTLASDVKYGTSAPANNNGVYPYLRMNNIDYNGFWNFKDLKYINVDDSEKDKYLLRNGDLVFNRTNSRELVGKTAVYNKNNEIIIAGYLIRVRTNELANPWFIWGYLNSKIGKSVLFDLCNNIIGMANINATKLKAIQILIPPKQLQDKFASIVTKIEATKAKSQSSLDELNNLFNSTAQKAFKGELNLGNIKVIEKEISKEESQVLDEDKVLELIQSGSFEAKDYVNEKQNYDDIRDMVLKLMDEGKITQKFTDDKKMVLEIKQ